MALGFDTGTATCMEKFCGGKAVGWKRHTHRALCGRHQRPLKQPVMLIFHINIPVSKLTFTQITELHLNKKRYNRRIVASWFCAAFRFI